MRNLRLVLLAIVLLGAAAWIWLASDAGDAIEATPTDAPAATARAEAAPSEVGAPARAAVAERQEVTPEDVRTAPPEPAQLAVRARFVDENGGACAALSIRVGLAWPPQVSGLPRPQASGSASEWFDTDAAGDLLATLAAPSGDALLHVEHYSDRRSLQRIARNVTLAAGDNHLDLGVIEMQTRWPIQARVVDETGQPFLGASIRLRATNLGDLEFMSAPPDSNLVRGSVLAGSYILFAAGGGRLLGPLRLEVPRETAAIVEVVVRRETTLSGVVRDAAGQPVPAVTVFVEDADQTASVKTPTGEDGAFTLRGDERPPGHQGLLWVFSGGRYALAEGVGTPAHLPVSWGTRDVVVRLVATSCSARVRVVRASDRQPLTAYRLWVDPPAEVRTRYPDAFAGWVPGDAQHADGVVTVPHVVPDLQTLLVVPEDRALALTARELRADSGENGVEIAVSAAPETAVRCVGASGDPVDAQLELLVDEGDVPLDTKPTDIRVTPPGAWQKPPTRWRHDSTTAVAGRGVLRGGQLGDRALVHAPDLGVMVPVTLAARAEVVLVTRGCGELVVRFTECEFTSLAPRLLAIPQQRDCVMAVAEIGAERVTLALAAGVYDLHLAGHSWSNARTPSLARVEVTAATRTEVTLDGAAWRPGLLRWRAPESVQFRSRGSTTFAQLREWNRNGFHETALLPGEYDAVGDTGVARVRIAAGATQELEFRLQPSPFVLVLRRAGAPVVGRQVVWVVEGLEPGVTPPLGKSDAAGRVPVATATRPCGMHLAVEGVAAVLGPFDWPDGPELVVELPN
jgi:hypothetical protein